MTKEHAEFKSKLERIQRAVNAGNLPVALSLLLILKAEVLRHAVEEEAILARSIMRNAKKKSTESVKVLQGHRTIAHFFNDVLPTIQKMSQSEARKQIDEFVSFLVNHHQAEEDIVFPLATGEQKLQDRNLSKSCNHLEVTQFGSYLIRDLHGKRERVILQQCSNCNAHLTMDGTEIPASRIEGLKVEPTQH